MNACYIFHLFSESLLRGWLRQLWMSEDASDLMLGTGSTFREDARFRILHLLRSRPELSQRQISKELGVSLGGVNYCIKGLVEKGHVKIQNVRRSSDKKKYVYLITPKGIAEQARLAAKFLARRMREFEAIKAEIEALKGEISINGIEAGD